MKKVACVYLRVALTSAHCTMLYTHTHFNTLNISSSCSHQCKMALRCFVHSLANLKLKCNCCESQPFNLYFFLRLSLFCLGDASWQVWIDATVYILWLCFHLMKKWYIYRIQITMNNTNATATHRGPREWEGWRCLHFYCHIFHSLILFALFFPSILFHLNFN